MREDDITTHVVAVTAIVKKDNKYLLASRDSKDPQAGGQWSFPGGKVDIENGDNILEKSLQREIEEEVGIKIKDNVNLIYNDGFVRVSGHHVVMLTFLCFYESGKARPLEGQEEVKWLSMDELLAMKEELPSYTLKRVLSLKDYESKN